MVVAGVMEWNTLTDTEIIHPKPPCQAQFLEAQYTRTTKS